MKSTKIFLSYNDDVIVIHEKTHAKIIHHTKIITVSLNNPIMVFLLNKLGNGSVTLSDIAEKIKGPAKEIIQIYTWLALLKKEGILKDTNKEPFIGNKERLWEFHDLYFHLRSRRGYYPANFGATYRFKNKIPHGPVIKPAFSNNIVFLEKPAKNYADNDPCFQKILDSRRSIRGSKKNITLSQLTEFLYRTLHIKRFCKVDDLYEASCRIAPNGGGLHELEIYFYSENCQGLTDGFYYYLPEKHALNKIDVKSKDIDKLKVQYKMSIGGGVLPEILFVISSRLPRVTWKYESIAYALTLKNLGALYQTFYLAATTMNLSPCALGCGDSTLFADLTGLDPLEECSIGEFILGG